MPGHPPLHQAEASTSDLHPSYSAWGQGGCYQKNESGNKCLSAADGRCAHRYQCSSAVVTQPGLAPELSQG